VVRFDALPGSGATPTVPDEVRRRGSTPRDLPAAQPNGTPASITAYVGCTTCPLATAGDSFGLSICTVTFTTARARPLVSPRWRWVQFSDAGVDGDRVVVQTAIFGGNTLVLPPGERWRGVVEMRI